MKRGCFWTLLKVFWVKLKSSSVTILAEETSLFVYFNSFSNSLLSAGLDKETKVMDEKVKLCQVFHHVDGGSFLPAEIKCVIGLPPDHHQWRSVYFETHGVWKRITVCVITKSACICNALGSLVHCGTGLCQTFEETAAG